MTDRSKLLALAKAVEALSEPSIEIDTEIARTIYADNCRNPDWECGPVLPYTASLDAAMTLAPEGQFLRFYGEGPQAIIVRPFSGSWLEVSRSFGASNAAVVAAAAIRAQAEALA